MATRDLTRAFLQLRADEKAKVLRRKNIVSHREEGNALMKSADQEATQRRHRPRLGGRRERHQPARGAHQGDDGEAEQAAHESPDGALRRVRVQVRAGDRPRHAGDHGRIPQRREGTTADGAERQERRVLGRGRQDEAERTAVRALAWLAGRRGLLLVMMFSCVSRALATQLQTLSGDFRKSQKTYLARVKNQKEGPVEFDFLAENEAKQKRRGDTAQITEVEIAEDVINERDQEIQRIATSITELATIFKELAVLVIDQGTILDRIDYNMEQVVEQTEKGIEELEKAEETQKNGRPMNAARAQTLVDTGGHNVCVDVLQLKNNNNPRFPIQLLSFKKCVIWVAIVILWWSKMDVEVKQQQALMRSLRVFVDALRGIKKTQDAADVHHDVVEAVRVLCAPSETQDSAQWHDEAWRHGLVPIFQKLCLCMMRLDALEAKERNKVGPKAPRQAEKPKAPAGLLSLRDYSVLQAALELLFCWGAYPRVAAGVLMPIEKRRPTRTFEISKDVLMWGYRGYTRVMLDGQRTNEETTNELLGITQALLQLLSLPQFQPILLPKYVVELLALLVYGEVAMDTQTPTPVQAEFCRLREMVLRVLPLRMSMSSLRAALGQASPVVNEQAVEQRFKVRCGNLLSRLLMEGGGIVATIEMLLGAVEEGNTQARMQVATLICQIPSGEDPTKYASALCAQVRELLLAAVTPEKGNTSSKLLGEMAALLADQMATRHPALFDTEILSKLFHPLLIYEDSRLHATTPSGETNEVALTHCVEIARLLLCGPPPSQRFLQALAPLVRPLLHMYAFAATSKSFLAAPLRALLTAWIRSCSSASLLLQLTVLPATLPLQPTLTACGYQRKHDQESWRPLRQFCAGGGGGISLRPVQPSTSLVDQEHERGSLKMLIMPLVELLGAKELENSEVVGDLFSSLLLTYMHVRKHGESDSLDLIDKKEDPASPLALYEPMKSPTSAEGVEMVLTLLLALIECLGPSVLRSAAAVLQCIGTVLETYNTTGSKLVDKEHEEGNIIPSEEAEEEEENDEILTICLGVVMTILEAGSSHRSDLEEQQLRAMLPVLEVLSRHPRPEVAELSTNARAQILSRGATKVDGTNTTAEGEQSFEEVLQEAEKDLSSELVPLRARGVVALTKLVRRSRVHAHDAEWTPRVHALASVFLLQLHDSESYVFLAAVQGLAALADAHPGVAIPALVKALLDSSNSLESRIKLSEALLFSAKRCGDTLPKYGKIFVYAYLDCIRPPPSLRKRVERMKQEVSKRVQLIQEVENPDTKAQETAHSSNEPENEQELLAAATLRSSCLSNLAEICALLQWGLQPFVLDVMTERRSAKTAATPRGRAAAARGGRASRSCVRAAVPCRVAWVEDAGAHAGPPLTAVPDAQARGARRPGPCGGVPCEPGAGRTGRGNARRAVPARGAARRGFRHLELAHPLTAHFNVALQILIFSMDNHFIFHQSLGVAHNGCKAALVTVSAVY
ncbi:hypothetical protein ON010_g7332 [Phytophthora cinnamomi]|nr:hypothetical protein ON010_g7332 [Phytophthora cinnamomi]